MAVIIDRMRCSTKFKKASQSFRICCLWLIIEVVLAAKPDLEALLLKQGERNWNKTSIKACRRNFQRYSTILNVTDFCDVPVELQWNPTGVHRAASDKDMARLYRENLAVDLKHWPSTLSLLALRRLLGKLEPSLGHCSSSHRCYTTVVAIRDNHVWLPLELETPDAPATNCRTCHWRVQHTVAMLKMAIAQMGFSFPDVLFVLNTWDEPLCFAADVCAAPVLSIIKMPSHHDVLVPQLWAKWHYRDLPLMDFPREKKVARALMRANLYRAIYNKFQVQSRYWLAYKMYWEKRTDVLDAGVPHGYQLEEYGGDFRAYDPNRPKTLLRPLPKSNTFDIPDHARFKFLLHTDGVTASSRLGKIMHCNSVILKEESDWMEWYYRSLVPGVHYLPFWQSSRDDIFPLLKRLSANTPRMAARLKQISQTSQHFAFRYINTRARLLYFRQALLQYKQLLPDMDVLVGMLPQQGSLTLQQLMAIIQRASNTTSGDDQTSHRLDDEVSEDGGSQKAPKKRHRRQSRGGFTAGVASAVAWLQGKGNNGTGANGDASGSLSMHGLESPSATKLSSTKQSGKTVADHEGSQRTGMKMSGEPGG